MRSDSIKNGVSIYMLIDPQSGSIRYLGKSKNPDIRLREHLSTARKGGPRMLYVHRWLAKLLRQGLRPTMVIIGVVSEDFWATAERSCIRWLRDGDHPLTNLCEGGRGVHNPSQEVRERISNSLKGHVQSAESRAKKSATLKGRVFSNNTRQKISEAMTGKKLTAEHKAKIGAKSIGRKCSPEGMFRRRAAMKKIWANPEYKKRMAEKMIGRKMSAESRAKMRAAQKGRIITPEHADKIRKALKGRKADPEHKLKISEGLKLAYAEGRR